MNQFTIMKREANEKGQHSLLSQSGRTSCWLDGWIAVPEEFRDAAWACCGFCDVAIENDVITGLTPNWEARDAANAAAKEAANQPTETELAIAALQEQLDAADEASVELYEAQLAQEEADAARDETLNAMQEQLDSADETAVELYEAQEAASAEQSEINTAQEATNTEQSEINSAQDEALAELYELIGG